MVKNVHCVAKPNDTRVGNTTEDSDFASLLQKSTRQAAAMNLDAQRTIFPLRTGLAAASLLILGSILIAVSFFIGLDEEHRGLSFLILGLLAFIPGSYATYQLYGAWKGWKGYYYDQLPSYDD